MLRDSEVILLEIRELIDELEGVLGKSSTPRQKTSSKQSTPVATPKGALGAIMMLIEEGFLDTPKEASLLAKRLQEIGHYHKSQTIAMNLLNLTRRRTLNRFKNKETKNWEYVIRK